MSTVRWDCFLWSHFQKLAPLQYSHFSEVTPLWQGEIYFLMTENISLLHKCQETTMAKACNTNFWWSASHLSFHPPLTAAPIATAFIYVFGILLWLPSYSFTGSYPLLLKVIYNSLCSVSNILFFQQCCPYVQQPVCIYSFISFVRTNKQLSHSCKNWKNKKVQLAWSCGHGITWNSILLRFINNLTGRTYKHQKRSAIQQSMSI